jgi:antirestriction protein ArdC
MNLVSKKAYRGINVPMLWGGETDYWLTYRQARVKGGQVRKGEKGSPVVFWQFNKHRDADTGKEKTIPFLRYYTVFNLSQCEGIEAPAEPKLAEHDPIHAAEGIMDGFIHERGGPRLEIERSNRAFYRPSDDSVTVPLMGQHKTPDEYYSTVFHELGHSTGHHSRLDRDMSGHFGNHAYSKEELVAEFTACFLCRDAGINTTMDNSAAYLQGWVSKFREQPDMLMWAASRAQRAADHIAGTVFESGNGEG